ncbi:MAG: hypothetical protein EOP49_50935, partial [Sphingobacteriales bacterium]
MKHTDDPVSMSDNTSVPAKGSRCIAFSLLLFIISGNFVFATASRTSLTNAIAQKMVTISSKASGKGYNNKGLSLNIENTTRKALEITIDPALIFRPDDTSYQDLILAGRVTTTIEAGKSRSLELQSYCGKSYARAPSGKLNFIFSKQADSNMIKTLDFV